jgi:hypothetical protein
MSGNTTEYPREEVERAFEKTLELQNAENWEEWLLTLTEDAIYAECEFGVMRGRDEIGTWLIPDMKRNTGWTFPERFRLIDGNRVSFGWWNRLPGKREDGSHFEFMGTSYKIYAGNRLFSYHEDVYNLKHGIEVIKEWHLQNREI